MESTREWFTAVSSLGLATVLVLLTVWGAKIAAVHIDRAYVRPLIVAHLDLIQQLKKFVAASGEKIDGISADAAAIKQAVTKGVCKGRRPARPGRKK